jgi:hypothetical protein
MQASAAEYMPAQKVEEIRAQKAASTSAPKAENTGSQGANTEGSGGISDFTDEERYETLKIRLPGGDAFSDARLPQKYALEWLAKVHPMKVSVVDEFMLERYILAVLFFSTTLNAGGVVDPTWTHTNDNWMTGEGYCSWYGVECLRDKGFI